MSGSGFAGSQATGDKRQTFNTFFRDLAVEVKAKGNEAGPLKHDWQGLFKILNTGQKLLAEALAEWTAPSLQELQTWIGQLPTGSLHSPRIHTLINFVGFTVYKRYTALGKSDKDKYGTVARAMCGFVEEAIKFCSQSMTSAKEDRQEEQIKQCYRSLLYRVTIEQTASKWKPASELGVMAARALELAMQGSKGTVATVRDGCGEGSGTSLAKLSAAAYRTNRSLSCYYLLKILLNIAQDSVAGVIAEDSQLRLSQLLKDEGLADAQLQQDIGKLLSNRDVEQVEEICAQAMVLLGGREQSLHQAMPLLAAFGDHGSAPSIQKYNGKDLILLDPYRLTLVVIDKKGVPCIRQIAYEHITTLKYQKLQDSNDEALLRSILIDVRTNSKGMERITVICNDAHDNWPLFRETLTERCNRAYGRSSVAEEPADLSVPVAKPIVVDGQKAASASDTAERREEVAAGIANSTPSHSVNVSPAAIPKLSDPAASKQKNSSASTNAQDAHEHPPAASEEPSSATQSSSADESPSVRVTRSSAKATKHVEQETGSLKESAAAAASRKSRKSQASGAQQDKEQKSSQDVTSQSAQAHEPSRQALEADEDAQGVPAQELEDRPDVQQDAETCASEKAQVRDVLKVSYVKIPKTTYGGARNRRKGPVVAAVQEDEAEDEDVRDADELPPATKTTIRKPAFQSQTASKAKSKATAADGGNSKAAPKPAQKQSKEPIKKQNEEPIKKQTRETTQKQSKQTEQSKSRKSASIEREQSSELSEAEPEPVKKAPSPVQHVQPQGDEQVLATGGKKTYSKRKEVPDEDIETTESATKRVKPNAGCTSIKQTSNSQATHHAPATTAPFIQTRSKAATPPVKQVPSAATIRKTHMSASSPGPMAHHPDLMPARANVTLPATNDESDHPATARKSRLGGAASRALAEPPKAKDVAPSVSRTLRPASARFAPYPKKEVAKERHPRHSEGGRPAQKSIGATKELGPDALSQVIQAVHDQVSRENLRQQVLAEMDANKLFAEAGSQYEQIQESGHQLVALAKKLSTHYRDGEAKVLASLKAHDARALKKTAHQARKFAASLISAKTVLPDGLFG